MRKIKDKERNVFNKISVRILEQSNFILNVNDGQFSEIGHKEGEKKNVQNES